MKYLYPKIITSALFIVVALLINSCGGGGKTTNAVESNTGASDESNLPNNINGLLALNTWSSWSQDNYKGIYIIDFSNGEVTKHRLLTTFSKGVNPYIHDRQTITYAERCIDPVNFRIKIINENGVSSAPILPCTTAFNFEGYGSLGRIKVAKYSSDRTKIALEIYRGAYGSLPVKYEVKVFDVNSQNEIGTYTHFVSPDWNNDGSLLLSASDANQEKGIYIVNKDFLGAPRRIDQGKVNQSVINLDVSPSGEKLIFSMSGQIWMMSINNNDKLSDLQKIISENANLNSATWSPDGKYIAYLSFSFAGDDVADKKITFFDVVSHKPYVFDTKTVFPPNNGLHWMTPRGYLSWVK